MTEAKRPTCSTCLYWDAPTKECRVHPPQMFFQSYGGGEGDVTKVPLITSEDYWCGRHSGFASYVYPI